MDLSRKDPEAGKGRKELEVAKYKEEIEELVMKNEMSVITGWTGCGKST